MGFLCIGYDKMGEMTLIFKNLVVNKLGSKTGGGRGVSFLLNSMGCLVKI
jgi:hypothetical protein